MGIWDILFLATIIVLVLGIAFYFLNKWASKKTSEQHDLVEQNKQSVSIYVIDKKKDKITNANLPKAMQSQIPRMGRIMKMPLVKAKIGPQIVTLICDNAVFPALPVKKNVTVEIAGAYIVSMKGMKTKQQLAEQRKARRKSSDAEPTGKWHEKLLDKFKR